MAYTDRDFKILNALESQEVTSQRQLAILTGISLGQVNYALKSLLTRGMIKLGNFKKNPNKAGYTYLITPKGLEEKSKLAVNFVIQRLKEYNLIKNQLLEKLNQIELKDRTRAIMVGPLPIRDLVKSAISENRLNIHLVAHYFTIQELKTLSPQFFDIAILCNETHREEINALAAAGISKAKILQVW